MVRLFLVWAVCGVLLCACAAPAPPRPNIVLYVVDTLRADRLGLYGYDESTSPNIDQLGAEGVVFEQAVAPAPWTLPSVTSLLLSQLPCEHGVLVDRDRIPDSAKPLATTLEALGYRTASFHSNPYVGKMTGLDRGYGVSKLVRLSGIEEQVTDWLSEANGDAPFFLYVHTVEPHNPEMVEDERVSDETRKKIELFYRDYRTLTRVDFDEKRPLGATDNADEQREALARLDSVREDVNILYDVAVREADARIGRLRKELEDRGLWENTVFVVLSDHGEELGDRGGWQHDQSAYDELIRVPLVIRFPAGDLSGRRVADPVGLIDVVPTLLDYLEVEPSGELRGRRVLDPERSELRVLGLRDNRKKYFRPYKESRGDVNVVLRRGPWKGIWNEELDTVELYHLGDDPLESNDLSASEPDVATAVGSFAWSALERCREGAGAAPEPAPADLDEETVRQLESLGYLDRSASPSPR